MRKARKLRRLYRNYLVIKYFAPIIISVGGAIIAKYGGDIQKLLKGFLKWLLFFKEDFMDRKTQLIKYIVIHSKGLTTEAAINMSLYLCKQKFEEENLDFPIKDFFRIGYVVSSQELFNILSDSEFKKEEEVLWTNQKLYVYKAKNNDTPLNLYNEKEIECINKTLEVINKHSFPELSEIVIKS